MRKGLSCIIATLLGFILPGHGGKLSSAEVSPGITLSKNGILNIGDLRLGVVVYAPGWQYSSQAGNLSETDTTTKTGATTITGILTNAAGKLNFSQSIAPKSGSSGEKGCRVSFRLSSESGVAAEIAALTISMPINIMAGLEITADGKGYPLPVAYSGEQRVPFPATAKLLHIPTARGIVAIAGENLQLFLQDDRKYEGSTFSLRITLNGDVKKITDATLAIDLFMQPYRFLPLPLTPVANMGFADEVAGDGTGGWTDQGKTNDLRAFKPGLQTLAGVEFSITDPQKNGGKSALVMQEKGDGEFKSEAVLALPAPSTGYGHLYLLHASAWVPAKGSALGTITAEYADGSSTEHPVLAGIDVGNWWEPKPLDNAVVAWRGENAEAAVGLYLTHLRLADKPVKALRLKSGSSGMWMLAGMTLASARVPAPRSIPLTIREGKNWVPLAVATEVQPGSILDFSALNDAPAGKHGPVVVRGGHFELADRPGQRIKFIGANLCFSANFLDKEHADRLAREWQLLGYNSVRLHHYDIILMKDGWKSERSDVLDPETLDKLDYVFAAMKKAGLYSTIDLYTIRRFAADEIPGWDKPSFREIKSLLPILPGAFEAWSRMALQLLNHVNPYTGLAWKDDPAFFSICPVNEDTLFHEWASYPEVKELYLKHFEEWLTQKGRTPANEQERGQLLAEFLIEVKTASNRQLAQFFKDNGVNALITGSNFITTKQQAFMRAEFDFVDNHQYWDHPGFPEKQWSLPYSHHQRSVLRALAETPRTMMPSRIFGKPFTVTEYNFTPPNQFRAEGGAVMGAYSALQDWDGLYRFAWSHNANNITAQKPIGGFDMATDPLSQLTERQILLLFARGDASPATNRYVYAVTLDDATKDGVGWGKGSFPQEFQRAGLVSQIGSQAVTAQTPIAGSFSGVTAAAAPAEGILAGNKFIPLPQLPAPAKDGETVSDNGETAISGAAGTIRVVTPRTECLGGPQGVALKGAVLELSESDTFCSVSASAMDDKPLAQSARVLILHLTNVLNSEIHFRDEEMRILESWGELPYLVQRGTAQLSLRNANAGLRLWAVDFSGKRVREVPAEYKDGAYHFTAETAPQGAQATMIYELAAE